MARMWRGVDPVRSAEPTDLPDGRHAERTAEPASRGFPPVAQMWLVAAVLGILLWAFVRYGQSLPYFRGLWVYALPPLYAAYKPAFAAVPWLIVCGLVAAFAGWSALVAWRRPPVAVLLGATVLLLLLLAAAVAMERGSSYYLYQALQRPPYWKDYADDAATVHRMGAVAFIRQFPTIVPHLLSPHSRTHPPGPVVIAAELQSAFPGHPIRQAVVLAVATALMIVPTWFLARSLMGREVAAYTAVLLVACPGVILLTFTSFDGVFATALVSVAALGSAAVARRSRALAAAAGAGAALTCLLTYAVVFVVLFVGLLALYRLGRSALLLLGIAAAAGLLTLGLLAVWPGFDLIRSYRAIPVVPAPPYGHYWVPGDPAAFLLYGGVAVGGLALWRFVRPPLVPALILLVPLVFFFDLPGSVTRLQPGEVQRTWLFAYPFLSMGAGAAVARVEHPSTRGRLLAGVAVAGTMQAALFQALMDNFW